MPEGTIAVFTKKEIDALFSELYDNWRQSPDWELLNRHAHLGIACVDSGRALNEDEIDPRVVELIKRLQPRD